MKPANIDPAHGLRLAAFLGAVRGCSAHAVARAMNEQTPGTDWRRCSKGYMAQAYARNDHHDRMMRVDLAKLSADALAFDPVAQAKANDAAQAREHKAIIAALRHCQGMGHPLPLTEAELDALCKRLGEPQ